MVRVSLHMVSLWLLLVLQTRGGPARCVDEKQAEKQWNRYLKRFRDHVRLEDVRACRQSQQNSSGTCDQAIKAMIKDPPTHEEKNQRSVSPWEYLQDQNEDRFPPVINMARCLCEGCIIHGTEDRSYNSVPVCADMMVLRKRACPNNQNRYVVQKEFISVPVACICVRPKY